MPIKSATGTKIRTNIKNLFYSITIKSALRKFCFFLLRVGTFESFNIVLLYVVVLDCLLACLFEYYYCTVIITCMVWPLLAGELLSILRKKVCVPIIIHSVLCAGTVLTSLSVPCRSGTDSVNCRTLCTKRVNERCHCFHNNNIIYYCIALAHRPKTADLQYVIKYVKYYYFR